jgi:hypothetical protein
MRPFNAIADPWVVASFSWTDQTQSIPPFALADLALFGIALPLVIKKLLLIFSYQLRITLGVPEEARPTQANAMTLAEGLDCMNSSNLICTDHFRIVTASTAMASRLSLQAFSLVVESET